MPKISCPSLKLSPKNTSQAAQGVSVHRMIDSNPFQEYKRVKFKSKWKKPLFKNILERKNQFRSIQTIYFAEIPNFSSLSYLKRRISENMVTFSHSSILLHLFPLNFQGVHFYKKHFITFRRFPPFLELTFNFRVAVHSPNIEECQAAYIWYWIEFYCYGNWLISCLQQSLKSCWCLLSVSVWLRNPC